MDVNDLKIKIFADGADPVRVSALARLPWIGGFTTNPTLMRKAGIIDYRAWAEIMLEFAGGKPISFEVLSDDFDEMERQARTIASWGENVYVKVPIINTKGESTLPLIGKLMENGVRVNITAIMSGLQLSAAHGLALIQETPCILSVFAGRIADTGIDPKWVLDNYIMPADRVLGPSIQLLWASAREILNIFHAQDAGCDIITLPDELLNKLSLIGKDLTEFSLETVKQFYDDAQKAGYTL